MTTTSALALQSVFLCTDIYSDLTLVTHTNFQILFSDIRGFVLATEWTAWHGRHKETCCPSTCPWHWPLTDNIAPSPCRDAPREIWWMSETKSLSQTRVCIFQGNMSAAWGGEWIEVLNTVKGARCSLESLLIITKRKPGSSVFCVVGGGLGSHRNCVSLQFSKSVFLSPVSYFPWKVLARM